jgi:hypothetical protein
MSSRRWRAHDARAMIDVLFVVLPDTLLLDLA